MSEVANRPGGKNDAGPTRTDESRRRRRNGPNPCEGRPNRSRATEDGTANPAPRDDENPNFGARPSADRRPNAGPNPTAGGGPNRSRPRFRSTAVRGTGPAAEIAASRSSASADSASTNASSTDSALVSVTFSGIRAAGNTGGGSRRENRRGQERREIPAAVAGGKKIASAGATPRPLSRLRRSRRWRSGGPRAR